ncbi:hypothetical protein E2C01_089063 [Portunus trituberculatus]|uniref:Uncharacterized protein n=1 Tax=Portunus trituberculatus TaxID=210409 RepID=A0A5B7JI37_PORTR|nr:hypothetical protein [Portunus trituberculatus]
MRPLNPGPTKRRAVNVCRRLMATPLDPPARRHLRCFQRKYTCETLDFKACFSLRSPKFHAY